MTLFIILLKSNSLTRNQKHHLEGNTKPSRLIHSAKHSWIGH